MRLIIGVSIDSSFFITISHATADLLVVWHLWRYQYFHRSPGNTSFGHDILIMSLLYGMTKATTAAIARRALG